MPSADANGLSNSGVLPSVTLRAKRGGRRMVGTEMDDRWEGEKHTCPTEYALSNPPSTIAKREAQRDKKQERSILPRSHSLTPPFTHPPLSPRNNNTRRPHVPPCEGIITIPQRLQPHHMHMLCMFVCHLLIRRPFHFVTTGTRLIEKRGKAERGGGGGPSCRGGVDVLELR